MKNTPFIIIIILLTYINAHSQILQDTIDYSNSSMAGFVTGINNDPYWKSLSKYSANILAQKGIVPGVTIYGVAVHKTNVTQFNAAINSTLEVKYKCGSIDDSVFDNNTFFYTFGIVPYGVYYTNYSPNYYVNQFAFGGVIGSMQYSTTSNTLNIPDTPAWIPFILDQSFTYTGGILEVFTDWHTATTGSFIGAMPKYSISNFLGGFGTFYSCIPTSNCNNTAIYSQRLSLIIYHSPAPQPCSGIPQSGGITGAEYFCVGKNFHLYLVNPSAGPGISYQWQKTPIGSSSWVDISGATNAALSYNFPSAIPTNFRCKVTCTYSNLIAYTPAYPIYPLTVNIDSVSHSVINNIVTVHVFTDDTSSTYAAAKWNFGDSSNIFYYGNQVSKTYTIDGSYNVKVLWQSDCCADSLTFPITIGCAGSSTFVNTISAIKDSTCAGSPATLIINDTLPNNYSVQWYRFTWSGLVPLTSSTGASIQVNPNSPFDVYLNKATCTISGNFKYSNYDTVWVTPPPTAGTIQAINTTGNYYNFTNSGMSNAQSYKWHFGDGDSSNSIAPSHHYNLAGTYNVWFVVTNAGNGCTDTAFTNVTITTGVEDVQGKIFSVSPNPFNENFMVNCPAAKGSLMIVDIVGKVVKSVVVKSANTTIDMKGFANGVYLIKYQNESQTETVKIIKE